MASNDKCQKCGNGPDPDLRTLWMACFYEMNELKVPFVEVAIRGVFQKWVRDDTLDFAGRGLRKPIFKDVSGPEHQYKFYTLRVCKDCRATWMDAIADWFQSAKPAENLEANIPIRECGTTRMITREEWDRRQRDADR